MQRYSSTILILSSSCKQMVYFMTWPLYSWERTQYLSKNEAWHLEEEKNFLLLLGFESRFVQSVAYSLYHIDIQLRLKLCIYTQHSGGIECLTVCRQNKTDSVYDKNVMSKCQLTNVTPLYDKVVALKRASVAVKSLVEKDLVVVLEMATPGRNCRVTSKVSVLYLWCQHRILIRQCKYVNSRQLSRKVWHQFVQNKTEIAKYKLVTSSVLYHTTASRGWF